jgi:hypothetical protein
MLTGIGPISAMPTEGGGSWVWALAAIGVVVVFLALTWFARLWGLTSATSDEEPDVPAHVQKAASGRARTSAFVPSSPISCSECRDVTGRRGRACVPSSEPPA